MPLTGEMVDVMIPLVFRREPETGELAVPAAGRISERRAVHAHDYAGRVAEQHANLAVGEDALLGACARQAVEEPLAACGRDLGPRVLDEAELDLEGRTRVGSAGID